MWLVWLALYTITSCFYSHLLYSVAEIIPQSRLVVFGDLHGDILVCRRLLQAANITDADDQWIAGSSTVVQLGDIADRGPHYHEIYELFASLEQQAKAAGGEFTFIIGNHELLNLIGDYRFAHPSVVALFGGKRAYAKAFSSSGVFGSYILQHKVVLVREGVVFVHAGILPEHAKMGVDGINVGLISGFYDMGSPLQDFGPKDHVFSNSDSPLWTRTIALEAQRGNCTLLTESLRLLSEHEMAAGRPRVHTMLSGHTIQPGGSINMLCDGQLVLADVGLSRYMGNRGGYTAYVELLKTANNLHHPIPVPQYPFGKGFRSSTPSLIDEKLQKPRCFAIQQQLQRHGLGDSLPLQPSSTQKHSHVTQEESLLIDITLLFFLLVSIAFVTLSNWRLRVRDRRGSLRGCDSRAMMLLSSCNP